MPTRHEVRLPAIRAEAHFDVATVNETDRTVEILWYTGAPVKQFSILEGAFEVTLSMDPKSVRLGTLNSGRAPFKAGHAGNSDIRAVLGRIERAWLAPDGGRALVRFSKRPDVEPIFQDVKEGILSNVSMEAVP